MIKLQVIGNLGSDATIGNTGSGKTVCNFSVAHSSKIGTTEYTTWVNCSWWGEVEKVAAFLKKGTKVYVEGYPEAKPWKDKEGGCKADLTMSVISLELLSPKKEGE